MRKVLPVAVASISIRLPLLSVSRQDLAVPLSFTDRHSLIITLFHKHSGLPCCRVVQWFAFAVRTPLFGRNGRKGRWRVREIWQDRVPIFYHRWTRNQSHGCNSAPVVRGSTETFRHSAGNALPRGGWRVFGQYMHLFRLSYVVSMINLRVEEVWKIP